MLSRCIPVGQHFYTNTLQQAGLETPVQHRRRPAILLPYSAHLQRVRATAGIGASNILYCWIL
jgi:hypothetical protein